MLSMQQQPIVRTLKILAFLYIENEDTETAHSKIPLCLKIPSLALLLLREDLETTMNEVYCC